jgi:Holliday junction resolvase
MGASERRKGHNFERQVAVAFRDALGLSSDEVKRGLGQPRGGTAEEPDVVLPPEFPMWLECKVGKRPNLLAAMEQARKAIAKSGANKAPVAVCKRDREKPVVVLELDVFLVLLAAAEPART